MQDRYPGSFCTKLVLIVLLETFIILPMIIPLKSYMVSKSQQMQKISKDTGDQSSDNIYTSLLADKCHTLAGTSWPTEEKSSTLPRRNFSFNPIEPSLWPDYGQMMCILLFDRVRSEDRLVKEYGSSFAGIEDNYKINKAFDGMSYIFYDLGKNRKAFERNLSLTTNEIGKLDVLIRPVDVDYAVISVLAPDHFSGGLGAMLEYRPNIPVFIPPAKDARSFFSARGYSIKNLIELPPGYTKMSNRIGILVLPWRDGRGDTGSEADLVVEIRGGIAIIAGEGKPGMERIIDEAEKNTGKKVILYTGGTDLMKVLPDVDTFKYLERMAQKHPELRICANYSTSLLCDRYCSHIFGNRYSRVYLGTSVALPHPSWFYRWSSR